MEHNNKNENKVKADASVNFEKNHFIGGAVEHDTKVVKESSV